MTKSVLVQLIESEAREKNPRIRRLVAVTIKLAKLEGIDQADEVTREEFKSLWSLDIKILRQQKQAIFTFTPNGAFLPKQVRPIEHIEQRRTVKELVPVPA